MTILLFVFVVIYIYHHRIVFLLSSAYFYFTRFGSWAIWQKKSKKRERASIRSDSSQPLNLKTATRTHKRRPTTSQVSSRLQPTPHTHYYCNIVFTVGICLRTDRYLKEYSIEREIWSIEEERTNARARAKRVNDVATFRDTFSGGDKREKR